MSLKLPLEIHTQVTYKNQTAIELLEMHPEVTREQLIQCFENGAVWLESGAKPHRIYNPDTRINPANRLHLYCNQSTLATCPHSAELVADFSDFSIWNKPSGMLSQGSKWGDHWALYRWIKQHVWPDRETFITHRLDRFTCGLIIVAHDKNVNKIFHRQFEKRQVQKTYRAIVSGLMPVGKQITLDTAIEDKPAKTRVLVLNQQQASLHSLLQIKPETGRKHQIRVHLAEIGHPVLNDRNYGKPPHSGDLKLQATGLEFIHPTENSPVKIELNTADLLSV